MDYRLAALDEQLADIYNNLPVQKKEGSPSSGLTQSEWLKHRNQCLEFDCVVETYASRIKQLQAQQNPIFSLLKDSRTPWEFFPISKDAGFYSNVSLNKSGEPVVRMAINRPQFKISGFNLRTNKPDEPPQDKEHGSQSELKWISQAEEENPIDFGATTIVSTGELFSSCDAALENIGIEIKRKSEPWRKGKTRRLVLLEILDQFITPSGRACSEEERDTPLYFSSHEFFDDFIWNKSAYLHYFHFYIRFDNQFNTYSSLIGNRILIPDGQDLAQLIHAHCKRPGNHDGKFLSCMSKVIIQYSDIVSPFYKNHGKPQ